MTKVQARRTFLRYLAGSPLFACGALAPMRGVLAAAEQRSYSAPKPGEVISAVEEAVSVFDFEAVARQKLPPAHYGYVATGTEGNVTLRANREGFRRFQLRMRRLVDVREVDTSIELFGTRWNSPIALAPAGTQKAFHSEGEAAAARAARETSSLQILSTVSNVSVEEVTRERGEPVWFQLYAGGDWSFTRGLLKRAEAAGCPVVAFTVDMQGGSNREMLKRLSRIDKRDCTLCHDRSTPEGRMRRRPMYEGLDMSKRTPGSSSRSMTWDFARRIQDATSMKTFIKGIVTAEDAELCVENGLDGIIVSNHGGRAEASGRSTIECLPEIVKAVQGRIPVIIDSGFRRGTDVFKALALGANAVAVGRPYLWGLASFGQEGVRAALDLLLAELTMVMRQAGATSIDKITGSHILRSG